jgi:phosphoglycerate dehydrogenase-like enzyme
MLNHDDRSLDAARNPYIFLCPFPRQIDEIFDAESLVRLRGLGPVFEHREATVSDELWEQVGRHATIIIGQFDLSTERLRSAINLRAIFNIEGNFLPNVDYAHCRSRGIRVLNISPVFAEPVAECALGMAIDLARGITRADLAFRHNEEQYGLASNREAYSLHRQTFGLIGFGDLGRALLPLLRPWGGRILAYDPWLSPLYIRSHGCEPQTLEEVLTQARVVFVVAGATAQNQRFLGEDQFALMQQGSIVVLVSRAGVVDFDAMLAHADSGHIRVATDVFPTEPLPPGHFARIARNVLLSPHQAGALGHVLYEIGRFVVSDSELIARGLPAVTCREAQPETASQYCGMPVTKS